MSAFLIDRAREHLTDGIRHMLSHWIKSVVPMDGVGGYEKQHNYTKKILS